MCAGAILKLLQNRSISDNPMRSGSSHNDAFYSRDKVGWLIKSIAALGRSSKGQLEGWIEPWKIEIDAVKADLAQPVSNV
jgi:hypothetical protein